jgi:excisionase family DNA binding protein
LSGQCRIVKRVLRCGSAKKFQKYLRDKREGGPIYTVEEVSDLLGIPRPTLYRYLREYSIPHLRQSGRISIPEESFERIREARDLHKEGLATESVRRLLREGGSPNTGELKERLDQLSENLERLRGSERPAMDEMLPAHALRTILARQNLLISAMFNLTEMVEELLLANGKPRKAVFDDVEDEIQVVAPPLERSGRQQPETPEMTPAAIEPQRGDLPDRMDHFFTPVRGARFGSLARRRRRGVLVILSVLMVVLLLTWALPTMGSELASGIPFFDASNAEKSSPGAPDPAAAEDEGDAHDHPPDSEALEAGSPGSGEARRVEIPDVSDRGVVEAAQIISRAGFEVAAIKSVESQKDAGTVMRTKPSAESAVDPETPIVIVMSGGPTGIPPGFRNDNAGNAAAAQYAN